MITAIKLEVATTGAETSRAADGDAATGAAARVTSAQVWRELSRASFAVVSYVTPTGTPRSAGVYVTDGQRLYVAVAPNSWKARHIAASGQVAVTVPLRRGGLLALVLPIPPATVSFHASSIVRPASTSADGPVSRALVPLLPPERRAEACIIEIEPHGQFVTYGLGVSLMQIRHPASAQAHVPVRERSGAISPGVTSRGL